MKRVLQYNAPPGSAERGDVRKKLQGALEYCLRDILKIPLKKPQDDSVQDVEITAPGRWQSAKDQAGEKFGGQRDGQITPAVVKIRRGEIYRFRADFGLQDSDLAALIDLANQPQLNSLVLYNCKHISESALSSLATYRYLRVLDLAGTNATDKVLESLWQMTGLKLLKVEGCQVSPEAVEQTRKRLPNCRIVN
jgi:hypothetical protein